MKKLPIILLISFFIFSCQSMLFYPQKQLLYNPLHVKYRVQDFVIDTKDNLSLHAWSFRTSRYFDNDSNIHKGAILFFHGNANNVASVCLQLLWLIDYGYDIFLADYRGYGISEGKATIDNVLSDSLDIMDAFIELYPDEKNIIVIGQSLGGQPASYVSAYSQYADKINLLVLDSTFTSWRSVAKEVSSSFWVTWAFQHLIASGFPDNNSAKDFLKQSKVKNILIMHSRADKLINYKNAEELYSIIDNSSTKKLMLFDNIAHASIFNNIQARKIFLEYINGGKSNY